MEKIKLEFAKELIENQMNISNKVSDEMFNKVIYGLFLNETFNAVIYELFGADFLRVTKSEILTDPRGFLEDQLDGMLNKINGALKVL